MQPNGLVAYYPLDEGTGNAVYDASSNANNGSLTSPTGTWGAGKVGTAYAVGSTSGDIRVPDNASLPTGQKMTVSLWAYGWNAANRALISQWNYAGGTPTSGAWALQTGSTNGQQLEFYVANTLTDAGDNYVRTPAGSWTSGWHHVTVTFDGAQAAPANRVAIYIDGVKQTLTVQGTIAATILDANAYLCIGDFTGLSRYFASDLDEVKLYNRTLSQEEVMAEYAAGVAGSTAGLGFTAGITPGVSQTSAFDAIVSTDSLTGYTLAVSQNQNLTKGVDTIGSVSGSIASPVSWTEGTTKGLGFTLYGTNATGLPGKWNSGNSYAAFPGTSTSYYTRTNKQSGKDIVNMRLRLDVPASQAMGVYTNVITTVGTITP